MQVVYFWHAFSQKCCYNRGQLGKRERRQALNEGTRKQVRSWLPYCGNPHRSWLLLCNLLRVPYQGADAFRKLSCLSSTKRRGGTPTSGQWPFPCHGDLANVLRLFN